MLKNLKMKLKYPKRNRLAKEKSSTIISNSTINDYDLLWGIDPGADDIFVGTNNYGGTVSASSRSYYHDSKFKESNRTIKYWQSNNKEVSEANKNMPSNKTTSLQDLCKYNYYVLTKIDLLLDFHLKKGFRDLKFKRYVFSQKTLNGYCKKFVSNRSNGFNTIVGLGDWSADNSSGLLKKNQPGPAKKFENKLKEYCTVVSVNEFRTSMLHNKCHGPLLHQRSEILRNNKTKSVEIHKVLFCPNKSCQGMTMDRDTNASKNILDLLIYELKHKCRHPDFERSRNIEEIKRPIKIPKILQSTQYMRGSCKAVGPDDKRNDYCKVRKACSTSVEFELEHYHDSH